MEKATEARSLQRVDVRTALTRHGGGVIIDEKEKIKTREN